MNNPRTTPLSHQELLKLMRQLGVARRERRDDADRLLAEEYRASAAEIESWMPYVDVPIEEP